MRTTFWTVGHKGYQLWWLLNKQGGWGTDIGTFWSDIRRFGTPEGAEGHRFFMYAKDQTVERVLSVVKIRVQRTVGRVKVVKVESDG